MWERMGLGGQRETTQTRTHENEHLRYVDLDCRTMEIVVAFMIGAITNKDTKVRIEINFVFIKWPKIGPTSGSKK